MLGRAVAVDGVEQALALVAGLEAVGVDLGQRAVGGERQVLQVARQAEQRRVTGLGVDAGDDHRVGAHAVAVLPAVAAEQQDVDPLLVAERVGAGVDGGRLPVVVEDPGDQVALGGGEPADQDGGGRDDARPAGGRRRRRARAARGPPATAAASGSRRRRPRSTAGRRARSRRRPRAGRRCRPRCGPPSAVHRSPARRRRRRGARNSTRVIAPSTRRPAARNAGAGDDGAEHGPAQRGAEAPLCAPPSAGRRDLPAGGGPGVPLTRRPGSRRRLIIRP